MTERNALKIVFGLSILGAVFSGTLSYIELFCIGVASCPVIAPPSVPFLSYPACIYGFGVFVVLTIVSAFGLFGSRKV